MADEKINVLGKVTVELNGKTHEMEIVSGYGDCLGDLLRAQRNEKNVADALLWLASVGSDTARKDPAWKRAAEKVLGER